MLGNLAITHHEQGRPAEALAHYEAALAIEREIGSRRDEAITLCNLADLLAGQGRTERARATFAAALALLRELGDRDTEAVTLGQLGSFELGQGLVEEAVATLHAALALTRETGNQRVQAFTLPSWATHCSSRMISKARARPSSRRWRCCASRRTDGTRPWPSAGGLRLRFARGTLRNPLLASLRLRR
jgi:tetratricopeptide (TPR) repeat protein